MQYVSIDKRTNQAHIWFRGQDLAEYLNVHRHTVYGNAKKSRFFHLKEHDIYVFKYSLTMVGKTKFEKFPESKVFKKCNAFKNEDLQPVVRTTIHQVGLSFLTTMFLDEYQKKSNAIKTLYLLKDLKDALNPCFVHEIDIIETLKLLVKEYHDSI